MLDIDLTSITQSANNKNPSSSSTSAGSTSVQVRLPPFSSHSIMFTKACVENGRKVVNRSSLKSSLHQLFRTIDQYFTAVHHQAREKHQRNLALESATSSPRFSSMSTSGGGDDAKSASKQMDTEMSDMSSSSSSKKPVDLRTSLLDDEDEQLSTSISRDLDQILLFHEPLLEVLFILFAPRNPPSAVNPEDQPGGMERIKTGITIKPPEGPVSDDDEEALSSLSMTKELKHELNQILGVKDTDQEADDDGVEETLIPLSLARSLSNEKTSTTSSSSQQVADPHTVQLNDFLLFASRHRRLLNAFCRLHPSLLRAGGIFQSLLWHSHILDFDIRRKFFKTEVRKLAQKVRQSDMTGVSLNIRRTNVFEDSYEQLRKYRAEQLKGKLNIQFFGEEGVDAGGLTREWFLVLSRAIFNPDYSLFCPSADNAAVFQPSKTSYFNPDHLELFRFVGRFVGKALFDGQRLDAYFTRSFYKHMLGMIPTYHDVESIDLDYHKTLTCDMDVTKSN